MFLFFSVARSLEIGSGERAVNGAQQQIVAGPVGGLAPSQPAAVKAPPKVALPKYSGPAFAPHTPKMSSAFDTAGWLAAA
jgi:hypothetical protein